ncbi:COX15/CtaA family protein [Candidatus Acetothermia bacterium]|nr:COX15/CtaA family protein [Candidatus Acetothermia bacterium]MBI3643038.1 COX15/CtaA family protein [Candidatus Acetothermia bacterium]
MFSQKRFIPFAWGALAYNVGVILWGAYVRATGSGAGCGSHWPLCNGEVIPQTDQIKTLIEYSHRVSSGISVLLILLLLVWAFRAFSKGHPARLGASLSTLFIITEALIGAGLVLFGLVDTNDSVARAFTISLHLVNTFLLLASLALTARWASTGIRSRLREQGAVLWLLGAGLMATMILGTSGALTALGDTLYPSSSLAQGVQQDLSPTAPLLTQLRLLHPVVAISVAFFWIVISGFVSASRPSQAVRRLSQIIVLLFLIQLALGALNVTLLAPVWLQIVHLLMMDLIWITLVLFASTALAANRPLPEARKGELGKPSPG